MPHLCVPARYDRQMASGGVRLTGAIASWNDIRGFGFIAPTAGGEDVFVHISAFAKGTQPATGDELSYLVEQASDGKTRAHSVRTAGGVSGSRRADSGGDSARARTSVANFIAIAAFVTVISVVNSQWPQPGWIGALYAGTSAATIIYYRTDKKAAVAGGRRVPEQTLLLLGLIGGWPGAIIAQQVLRHKTQKRSFRIKFWWTVVGNMVAYLLVATPLLANLSNLSFD